MNNLEPASSSSLLIVGKVIRPHGFRGVLRIRSFARSEASFLDAGTVFLRSVSGEIHEYTVTSAKSHKNILLMELEGLNSANEAEVYRGADILVKKEASTGEEDAYFWYELLGLRVYLDTGECIGTIFQIIPTGSNDIYMLKKGNKEFFIPAIHEVVREIDLENGKMVISPMEGLLDLNEV